jgi:hypothetical protein
MALVDNLRGALAEFARIRREFEEHGSRLPDDLKQPIVAMRQKLREAGLPQEVIDATPGLEPLD